MRRIISLALCLSFFSVGLAQTPSTPQKPQQEIGPEDVIRISTQLVQTDVVVTDNHDKIIKDLKLEDFELYDNGKKQELKFMEFVGVDTARRSEGERSSLPAYVEPTKNTGISVKDLKRVIGFVVDDLNMQIEDLPAVRKMLLDYVNTKMRDGDLVAIVRVVGGKGLLQQFTTDRQLLRRAIANITPVKHPYAASEEPDPGSIGNIVATPAADSPTVAESSLNAPEIFSSTDEMIRYNRSLAAITTANFVIDSLKQIPGRKNLVLITGGIPIFDVSGSGSTFSNTTSMLAQLTDNAFRAGVVINTLDPRGLRATPAVKGFQSTPAKSAMGGGMSGASQIEDQNFGKGDPGANSALSVGLDGAGDHLGLSTVSKYTGGVAVFNTNDFDEGLNKILARSDGYYTLAFRPAEQLDNKFHRLEIRVRRSGTKVYNHTRYRAREETATAPRTKEEEIAAAARSPLAKTEIDVNPNVAVNLRGDKSSVDVQMLIGAEKLHFVESPTGTYQTSLDVVAFIFDQTGKRIQGLSETVNLNLTSAEYHQAMVQGVPYSGSTQLSPGYYQVRAVVREGSSGNLGTFSKYLEIPDLTKGKLAMSSVFLFATDAKGTKPALLLALRQLNRKQDLRYVAMIYNPKLKDGKPQLRSQMIISQGNKVLFREPEQAVAVNGNGPVTKMGQLGLSGVAPGHYVLTLVITDSLADKKAQAQARSIDFNVVN